MELYIKNCQSNINIIERHSIHIKEQNNLLQEEYKLNSKNYTFSNINDQLFEYESSSYVMTPSEFVKDSFIKNLFDSNKVIVNPLGCNLSAFKCIEKTIVLLELSHVELQASEKAYIIFYRPLTN